MPSSLIYDSYMSDISAGNIIGSTDTFYVMLVDGYTPSKTGDTKRSNVTNEVTGTGYTAGGAASACTTALNTGSNQETWSFADVSWPASSFSATGAVIYKHRGGPASADNLVAYVDFGGTVTVSGGTFLFHETSPLTFQN